MNVYTQQKQETNYVIEYVSSMYVLYISMCIVVKYMYMIICIRGYI